MEKFENIHDFEVGQVFGTKKGKKMEVMSVYKDKDINGEDTGGGAIELKLYVHRDSQNITPKSGKGYGWGHNMKWFRGVTRLDGRDGLLRKLQIEGWALKNK